METELGHTRDTKSVLVIDDDEHVRRTIRALLDSAGFATRGAGDGVAGLAEVSRARPDLVLCDLRMPRMDGLGFLQRIRRSHPDLPILVMSGAGLLDDAIGALQLGAWDYVEKPVRARAALTHPLTRALERAALIDENRRYRTHLEEANRELRATLGLLADDEEAGRQIQFRMLPRDHQHFGPFEFSRTLVPSAFLSGDFIDAFSIGPDRWAFYLADVSGHGVSSALVTVLLRGFVHRQLAAHAQGGDPLVLSPARLLEQLNAWMCRENLEKHVTMFYGVIDNATDSLTYANAGQFPWPLLHDGEHTVPLAHPGLPVGLATDTRYLDHHVELPAHAVLAAFSDGLLEILPHADLAGKQRFLSALFGRLDVSVEQITRELRLDDRSLPDDIAMLLIKRGAGHGELGDPAGILRTA